MASPPAFPSPSWPDQFLLLLLPVGPSSSRKPCWPKPFTPPTRGLPGHVPSPWNLSLGVSGPSAGAQSTQLSGSAHPHPLPSVPGHSAWIGMGSDVGDRTERGLGYSSQSHPAGHSSPRRGTQPPPPGAGVNGEGTSCLGGPPGGAGPSPAGLPMKLTHVRAHVPTKPAGGSSCMSSHPPWARLGVL